MNKETFIHDAKVIKEINELKSYFDHSKPLRVSDVKDDQGHQYVDLVQEGGGVLGIALVGYTYALEEMGIRFYNLGGTSAGAINTAFLAAAATPNEKRSEKIIPLLVNTNLMSFIDGGRDAVQLVKALSEKKTRKYLAFNALNQVDDLIRGELGINRGDSYLKWLKKHVCKIQYFYDKRFIGKNEPVS